MSGRPSTGKGPWGCASRGTAAGPHSAGAYADRSTPALRGCCRQPTSQRKTGWGAANSPQTTPTSPGRSLHCCPSVTTSRKAPGRSWPTPSSQARQQPPAAPRAAPAGARTCSVSHPAIGGLTSPSALPIGESRTKSGGAITSTRATASSFSCWKTKSIRLATPRNLHGDR